MRIFDSKPVLRWMAPVAFVLVAAGGGLVAVNATADDKLAPRGADQLLVDLQQAKVDGLSGTVVQKANLGIPAIPGSGGGTSELTSLLSGTHTLRVWYSGPDKARVALETGDLAESDVITNGTDLWTWSSREKAATHLTIHTAERPAADQRRADADLPKTPQEAAAWALKALEPTTLVTTDSDVTVADRRAYDLVLRPRDSASTLTQIKVAIDGETHLPLRVQAFGTNDTLVFQVEYTDIDFTRPDDRQFTFKAPPDTKKVTEVPKTEHKAPSAAERSEAKKQADEAKSQIKTVGEGWTTVMVAKLPADAEQNNDQLQGFLTQLTKVSDPSWGSGRLLVGTAFSAVLTDDGRIAVGAVQPELLYKALQK